MPDTPLIDPLGRPITLHDRTWYGHIVKQHPDVRFLRPLAEDAVTSPQLICRHADPDCRLYYGPGPRGGVMIRVVADIVLGLVKTAHLCRKIDKGAVEWSPPTP